MVTCLIKRLNPWRKYYGVITQIKPFQQHFQMELFSNYVVLTVKSAEEMLWCSYSNKTSWVELGKIHFF